MTLDKLKRHKEAVAAYDDALRCRPDDASILLLRAESLTRLGELDDALATLEKFLDLRPDSSKGYYQLGHVLSRMRRHDDALEAIERCLELNPDYARAYVRKAVILNNLRRYSEALDAAAKAEALGLRDPHVFYVRGFALNRLGRLKEALKAFEGCLDVDRYADAHALSAIMLNNLGEYRKALAAVERAEALGLRIVHMAYVRAYALAGLGRFEEAVEFARTAVDRAPDNASYLTTLGEALYGCGKLEDALNAFEKAVAACEARLARSEDNVDILRRLVWLLASCPAREIRDPARAVELARKAVDLVPDDPSSTGALGAAQYRAGDYDNAAVTLRAALDLRSDWGRGCASNVLFLAMAEHRRGRENESRALYAKAVAWMTEHTPVDLEFKRLRAEAEEVLGIEK